MKKRCKSSKTHLLGKMKGILHMDCTVTNLLKHFSWHKARKKVLKELVIAVGKTGSVNLNRLAECLTGDTSLDGKIQRVERFFKNQKFDYKQVALAILNALGFIGKKIKITLDRTNWKFGKKDINYLVLAVEIEEYGTIPLMWTVLDKRGNSNWEERKALLDEFFKIFPVCDVECIKGDREFVGEEWMRYLHEKKVTFFLRVKSNNQVIVLPEGQIGSDEKLLLTSSLMVSIPEKIDPKGTPLDSPAPLESSKNSKKRPRKKNICFEKKSLAECFEGLQHGDAPKRIKCILGGMIVFIAATISKEGELVLVMTNQDLPAKKILKEYKGRWLIECLFKNLKGAGFNFEQTHLTDPSKLSKLMAICAFAICFTVTLGAAISKIKPIPYKKTLKSKVYSYFSYGLRFFRAYFNKISLHFFSEEPFSFFNCEILLLK